MIRISRATLALYVALVAVGALAFGVLIASPAPGEIRLGPCPTEDSANCYWDATERGNGLGRSFIDRQGTLYIVAP